MKIGIVVQRYGADVDGGAETLAREVAERLAREDTVEVFTSTARDYLTWRNHYPQGVTEAAGVTVRRFPVVRPRRVRSFGRLSERLYRKPHTIEDEIDWMIRQGPRVPALVTALEHVEPDFDAFLFFTYLYYPTFFGLPMVAGKSALVPTLHDEPPARLALFRSVFHLPRSFVWNTPEERELAKRMFGIRGGGVVAGFGVTPPRNVSPTAFRERRGLGDYLLFLGRIDVWKGIPELLEFVQRYRRERDPDLRLVLGGRLHMKLPSDDAIVPVGFLPESEKWEALAGATATVVPSAFESLSVVALESWAAGTPVVATAGSPVLRGQCRRSGGGIDYDGYDGFREALDRVRGGEGPKLGQAGQAWVAETATWDTVLAAYRRALLAAVAGSEA